jgi:hypothetical protein
MVRSRCNQCLGTLFFLTALAVPQSPFASAAEPNASSSRMNCGARIECLTPDGHLGRISRMPVQDPTAAALIMEDDTVNCMLQEGETNFVIQLPDVAVPDRFTFLNENGKAHGELKIAVSNQRLAPNSSKWKEVEGVIPFAHKRLFGVSLLGIEAKYVRLSFRVEKQTPIAAANRKDQDGGLTDSGQIAPPACAFSGSALNDALSSTVAPKVRPAPVLLSSIVSSVAPLRLTSN